MGEMANLLAEKENQPVNETDLERTLVAMVKYTYIHIYIYIRGGGNIDIYIKSKKLKIYILFII